MGLGVINSLGDWVSRLRHDGLENTIQRFYGRYPASVVNTADSQQQGRVQVKVSSLGFQTPHGFSFPVSPYAGTNHGFYFPPHANEQVLVAFEFGDIDCPLTVGSWWSNASKAVKPETSCVPPEFVDPSGGAPTRRGIKTRYGHGFVFEDKTAAPYVEFWSGKTPEKQTQGDNSTTVPVEAGTRTEKHNRIRLDDNKQEVVIATFGEAKETQQQINNDDSDAERDAKELANRLRNMVTLSDKDRFIEIRTVGAEVGGSDEHLTVLMSDPEKRIRLESAKKHYFEINDDTKSVTTQTTDARKIVLDDTNKKIVIDGTADGNAQTITQDDGGTTIIEDKGDVAINTAGTVDIVSSGASQITSDDAFNVDATASSAHTYNADLSVEVKGSLLQRALSALDLITNGRLTIQAAQVFITATSVFQLTSSNVTVNSSNVTIGTGASMPVLNMLAATAAYNAHTHLCDVPGAPSLPPNVPMTPAHWTTATKCA